MEPAREEQLYFLLFTLRFHVSKGDSSPFFCPNCYFLPLDKCKAVMLERVNATKACRQIGNSVIASCGRSSRIGNGLIDFSVGGIVAMRCPFTHLKNSCLGIELNTWFILKHLFIIFAHSVTVSSLCFSSLAPVNL